MTTRAIFVDVDDTLVRFAGTKCMPNPATIAAVRRLHAEGTELYLWSTGGSDYCRRMADQLGLANCFVAYLPKPSIYLDDQAVADWRNCRHVLPANYQSLLAET